MTNRDTQFLGFAQLVFDRLSELGLITIAAARNFPADRLDLMVEMQSEMNQLTKQILAVCAYDFLVSSHYHTAMLATWEESRERVALVPDMTEWPPIESAE